MGVLSQSSHAWPCGVHHQSCGAFLLYVIPTVRIRRMGDLRSRHANVLLELHWCRRDFCIWYLLLEPNGGRFWSQLCQRHVNLCFHLSKNPFKATNIEKLVTYFLKSGVKPYQVELMFGWCSVDVRFQNAQLLRQVGIITPYEGQRVIVSGHIVVFWLYFLWYLLISGIHQFHLVKAYICSVLQRQTCFSHKARTSNCQFAKVAPKNVKGNQGNLFLFTWSQGHFFNSFCRGLWGDWGC